MTTTRDTAIVRCPDCGGTREISVRQKRRLTNGSKSMRCSLCRTIPKAAKIKQSDLNYWLDRKDMEWIREVGSMIWGEEL